MSTVATNVAAAPTLLVDVRRAAEMLGVSIWTVRQFVANGHLPSVKLPAVRGPETDNRRVLIAVADIEAFVKRHREVAS